MAKKSLVPIDFPALKRALVGSGPSDQVNCGVITLNDGTASLKVHRTKSGKALSRELLLASQEAGVEGKKCCYGTAYMDEFPGTLCLALNRRDAGLDKKLHFALRGSGFGRVQIAIGEEEEA